MHNARVQVCQPLCHVVRYLHVPPHPEALQERLTLITCTTRQGRLLNYQTEARRPCFSCYASALPARSADHPKGMLTWRISR